MRIVEGMAVEEGMENGSVNAIRVLVEAVVPKFVPDVHNNQDTACDADGETNYVYQRNALVVLQVSQRDTEMVLKHMLLLLKRNMDQAERRTDPVLPVPRSAFRVPVSELRAGDISSSSFVSQRVDRVRRRGFECPHAYCDQSNEQN